MRPLVTVLVAAFSGVPALLALSALLGAGLLRRGPPTVLALVAVAVVTLPALASAVWVRRKHKTLVAAVALGPWSLAMLVAFPLFFPGERGSALATGMALLRGGGGAPSLVALAEKADGLLPAVHGARVPPPPAKVVDATTFAGPDGGAVELPTESHGRVVTVGATAKGPKATLELRMLFDTGASLTTLTRATLEVLGATVDPDGPTVTLHTASGEMVSHLAVLDHLVLSGVDIPNVTVAVCEACADHAIEGLLGLNVSSLFLVSLDTARDRVLLEPRGTDSSRILDIAPWTQVHATATSWLDGRIEVEVQVTNGADRPVALAEIAIKCEATYLAELRDVPRRGSSSTVVSLPRDARCDRYTAPLQRALW